MKPKATIDLVLFGILVLFAVLGRWFQPTWFFTPIGAVSLFAGYYLSSRRLALLVPLFAVMVSDLLLPPHYNFVTMLVVYATYLLTTVLGWSLRKNPSYTRLAACSVLPAVIFFLTTNFAVWASLDLYAPTYEGLVQCYVAGLPFFRMMLLADVLYIAVVFGAYAFAAQHGYVPSRESFDAA